MQKLERLEDIAWAANAARLCSMDTLPGQKRIRSLFLYCNMVGTKDAADTLSADLMARAISNVRLGNFVNISGLHLYLLNWAIHGRKVTKGTAIPGSGTTFDINFVLEIPFRDPRQPGSDDGSLPTELVIGKPMEVTFDSATVYGGTSLTITSGTVRVSAELVDETNTPQIARIGYYDPNSQTAQLDPGVYKELLLCEQSAVSITTAEVTSLDLEADGRNVHNNLLHAQLVHAWNARAAAADGTDSELAVNAAAFIPIIFHDRSGKSNLTKQVLVEGKGKLQLTAGTLTNYRLVFWRTEAKDEATVQKIATLIGAPAEATTYEAAVAKPSVGSGDKAKQLGTVTKKVRNLTAHLPGKFRATPNASGAAIRAVSGRR